MKKYNIPQIELLTVNAQTDIIRTSSMRLLSEGSGNDWDVSQAVNQKVQGLNN